MNKHFMKLENDWVKFTASTMDTAPLSGEEKGVADIYLDAFEKMGVEHYRDKAGNVIGILRGGEGPTVVLNGHMDVVPEGTREAWGDIEPYKGTVIDGKLYGRGSSDMLTGLSTQFFAFKEIKEMMDKGMKLNGTLVFTGVVFEEPAESAGSIELFGNTMKELGIKPDVVYLSEPSSGEVQTGQRGKVELVIDVYGKVAHSSAPWQGISAVEKAQPIISAIFNNFYEVPMNHEKIGFSAMTITDIVVTPGKMYSCVPDHCEITLDRRYVPPMTIPDTIAQVQKFLDYLASKDPQFKAEVHQRINHRVCYTGYEMDVAKQHPAWITDPNSKYGEITFSTLRALGQEAKESYCVAGTDGSISCGVYGIPTYIYSCVDGSQAHQPKEHTDIKFALEGIEGYTAILCKIFGFDFNQFKD